MDMSSSARRTRLWCRPTPNPDGIRNVLLTNLVVTISAGACGRQENSMGGLTARNLKNAVASVLMLLVLAGCGSTGGSDSTPSSATSQAPVAATLSASPATVDFGTVAM